MIPEIIRRPFALPSCQLSSSPTLFQPVLKPPLLCQYRAVIICPIRHFLLAAARYEVCCYLHCLWYGTCSQQITHCQDIISHEYAPISSSVIHCTDRVSSFSTTPHYNSRVRSNTRASVPAALPLPLSQGYRYLQSNLLSYIGSSPSYSFTMCLPGQCVLIMATTVNFQMRLNRWRRSPLSKRQCANTGHLPEDTIGVLATRTQPVRSTFGLFWGLKSTETGFYQIANLQASSTRLASQTQSSHLLHNLRYPLSLRQRFLREPSKDVLDLSLRKIATNSHPWIL